MSDTTAEAGAVTVREARAGEYPAIAELLIAAFTATFSITDEYRGNLARVAEHAVDYQWWVAVDRDDRPLGALMTPRAGGKGEEGVNDNADEFGFRLLGVQPQARGKGVAKALVDHVAGLARGRGYRALAIWSGPQMLAAHRLYASLGFVRRPERETRVVDGGQRLLSFTLSL